MPTLIETKKFLENLESQRGEIAINIFSEDLKKISSIWQINKILIQEQTDDKNKENFYDIFFYCNNDIIHCNLPLHNLFNHNLTIAFRPDWLQLCEYTNFEINSLLDNHMTCSNKNYYIQDVNNSDISINVFSLAKKIILLCAQCDLPTNFKIII